jgi:hypothetical protein
MNKLQDIFTLQETSRKLKEAGLSQENGIAYWCKYYKDKAHFRNNKYYWKLEINHGFYLMKYIRAWSFNELWKILPKKIVEKDIKGNKRDYYLNLEHGMISYREIIMRDEEALLRGVDYNSAFILPSFMQPQEAAAKLVLWCIEEGDIKPKGGKDED